MKIAVISDTHRHDKLIKEKIRTKVKDVDLIIHLGDNVEDVAKIATYYKGKILSVKGNCDSTTAVPEERVEKISGKRILIVHGHQYGVKHNLWKIRYRALEVKADIVLYGHTHIAKIDFEEGIWYINPGSAGEARDGANSIAIIEKIEQDIHPYIAVL